MKTPYKMKGYTYPGESPVKAINLGKLAKKIQGSKFGKSKLGEGLGNLIEKGGNVQKKFVDWKKDKGLTTKGYDATLSEDELLVRNEGRKNIFGKELKPSSKILTPSTPTAPDAKLVDISNIIPTVGEEINLEKIKVGPINKRTTRRTYAKRRKRK